MTLGNTPQNKLFYIFRNLLVSALAQYDPSQVAKSISQLVLQKIMHRCNKKSGRLVGLNLYRNVYIGDNILYPKFAKMVLSFWD